jgi:hypothetical protein
MPSSIRNARSAAGEATRLLGDVRRDPNLGGLAATTVEHLRDRLVAIGIHPETSV